MLNRSARLLLVGLSMLGASQVYAAQRAPTAQVGFARDLGLFAANAQGRFCLSIANADLQPGREITLIWVPVDGEPFQPEIRRGKVAAKLAAPCDDTNSPAANSNYRLEAGKLDNGRVYIAIATRPSNLRVAGYEVKARLGDREISLRSCTSTEGLHFGAWSGTGPKELPIWRSYYYLGYDVEPTCVERDF